MALRGTDFFLIINFFLTYLSEYYSFLGKAQIAKDSRQWRELLCWRWEWGGKELITRENEGLGLMWHHPDQRGPHKTHVPPSLWTEMRTNFTQGFLVNKMFSRPLSHLILTPTWQGSVINIRVWQRRWDLLKVRQRKQEVKLGLKFSEFCISSPVPKLLQTAANLNERTNKQTNCMSSNNRTASVTTTHRMARQPLVFYSSDNNFFGDRRIARSKQRVRTSAGLDRQTAITKP